MQSFSDGGVTAPQSEDGDGLVFAGGTVGVLLLRPGEGRGEVAVVRRVTAQALMAAAVGVLKESERQARKAARCIAGVVVTKIDLGEHGIPVVLRLVNAHEEHLGQGVVEAFDAAVGLGVGRSGGDDLENPQASVYRPRKLGGELPLSQRRVTGQPLSGR